MQGGLGPIFPPIFPNGNVLDCGAGWDMVYLSLGNMKDERLENAAEVGKLVVGWEVMECSS